MIAGNRESLYFHNCKISRFHLQGATLPRRVSTEAQNGIISAKYNHTARRQQILHTELIKSLLPNPFAFPLHLNNYKNCSLKTENSDKHWDSNSLSVFLCYFLLHNFVVSIAVTSG